MGARAVLPIYVSAADVQASLRCSRSTAYWHLARAARRTEDQRRRLLRVEESVWLRYVARTFGVEEAAAAEKKKAPAPERLPAPAGLRLVASGGKRVLALRETQPRTKAQA